jgi:hypothetical protein
MRGLDEAASVEGTLGKGRAHFDGRHVLRKRAGRAGAVGWFASANECRELKIRGKTLFPYRNPAIVISTTDFVDPEGVASHAIADGGVIDRAVGPRSGASNRGKKQRHHCRNVFHAFPLLLKDCCKPTVRTEMKAIKICLPGFRMKRTLISVIGTFRT